ncbi:MAG: tRNA (guanosine(46)-N7)-methyltransferase TrmB [Bacteroidales bacterium]|nr:tRNA (guanosine(46)-N7)-methyltransferase TrmB [Bacteroidales bacterium]
MAKHKLERFAEMEHFPNVLQPLFDEVFQHEHPIKGRWRTDFFKNNHPIVTEFGCGKGEYTVGLASKFPQKNFLGVDIKGARIWRGAKTALEQNINNAGFLRTRIEFSCSVFAENELDEIWVTFPDPQPKKANKRLTSAFFLNIYQKYLKPDGLVHLKTDNSDLYRYTLSVIQHNSLPVICSTNDLYASGFAEETFFIKTYYEKKFLERD